MLCEQYQFLSPQAMRLTLLRASLGLAGDSLVAEKEGSGKVQRDAAAVGDWLVFWSRVWIWVWSSGRQGSN